MTTKLPFCNMELIGLFLLMLPLCNSHPLGYILKMDDFITLKIISCGTIISEYYIMTTSHPLQMFSVTEMCALGFTPQQTVGENVRIQFKDLCMPVEAIHEAGEEARVVQTAKPIHLTHGVNVAMIPQLNSYANPAFKLSEPCYMYHHVRDDSKSVITNVDMVPFELPNDQLAGSGSDEVVYGLFKEPQEFCAQDTGVAVVCRSAVVGMMLMDTFDEDRCCITACDYVQNLYMINFLSPKFQNILLNYIKSEKSRPAVVFNNFTEQLLNPAK